MTLTLDELTEELALVLLEIERTRAQERSVRDHRLEVEAREQDLRSEIFDALDRQVQTHADVVTGWAAPARVLDG